MIAKIKGNVEAVNGNHVIVDVNGLGYEVLCPERSINAIEKNKFISLYIQTILRDDTINLYGFLSLEEKKAFSTLQTVQGVGAKLAMTIIGFFSVKELGNHIGSGDEKSICSAPGVGAKVAKRIITELKDVYSDQSNNYDDEALTKRNSINSALINLGYSQAEALNLIQKIKSDINDGASIEDLIKEALRRSD
ncbi:MAG: Holliday junction branch migration protein RuvA [Pseudomonadota bacterium]|nr:Holliday junction branch migration protein RuvA [Pseudomonadota bacterium]